MDTVGQALILLVIVLWAFLFSGCPDIQDLIIENLGGPKVVCSE